MKRKISFLLLIVAVVMSLTACGKFTCDFCGEEKSGKNHKSNMMGEDVVICQDCYNEMQGFYGGN